MTYHPSASPVRDDDALLGDPTGYISVEGDLIGIIDIRQRINRDIGPVLEAAIPPPRPENVPPSGAGSPRAATFVTTPLSHMKMPVLIPVPTVVAR